MARKKTIRDTLADCRKRECEREHPPKEDLYNRREQGTGEIR